MDPTDLTFGNLSTRSLALDPANLSPLPDEIITPAQNPSNAGGNDSWDQLFSQLIGTAGASYAANQQAQSNIAYAQAIQAQGNPLYGIGGQVTTIFSSMRPGTWVVIGVVLVFIIALRR